MVFPGHTKQFFQTLCVAEKQCHNYFKQDSFFATSLLLFSVARLLVMPNNQFILFIANMITVSCHAQSKVRMGVDAPLQPTNPSVNLSTISYFIRKTVKRWNSHLMSFALEGQNNHHISNKDVFYLALFRVHCFHLRTSFLLGDFKYFSEQ